MKALWSILSIVAIAHFLAILGFGAYLAATDRLNRDRIEQVREVFAVSVTEYEAAEAAAMATADSEAAENARLERIDDANTGADDRIHEQLKQKEILDDSEARSQQNVESLMTMIEQRVQALNKRQAELDARIASFEAERDRDVLLRRDEQFQLMMSILKGLKPDGLKAKIDTYLNQGKVDLVDDIMANLDKRTAQKLLALYTDPEDNLVAADLLERLRDRGTTRDGP